ncbi:hypothetical protein GCM10009718_34070 [Isoptericola halotolerans]
MATQVAGLFVGAGDGEACGSLEMVTLLMGHHRVTDVPSRQTADADLGADFPVVGDQRLVDALTDLGYRGRARTAVRPLGAVARSRDEAGFRRDVVRTLLCGSGLCVHGGGRPRGVLEG